MDGLEEELGRLGARVSPQWLAGCLAFLQGAQPGLGAAPPPVRAKAVLQQLLAADLNQCGAAALPPGVQGLHDTTLPGKLLLQVDEVLNIAAAVRERYSGHDGGHRCLKLLLTDGVQQVAAVEYRPTPALHSAMPAGCKLVVQGAAVRRGILLLTPQCCAVLGGGVPRLEDARRRMVAHWSQPAVGRRGPLPTMAQATAEATRAAWAGGPAPGTDDDPICLDEAEDEQRVQPGGSDAAAGEGDVAMAAADEQEDAEGWEDEEAGPHLDPWEQGYEAAEDEEQLPDADLQGGGGWQDGEGWEADGGWQDDGGEAAMEVDAPAGEGEQRGQGDAAAEAAGPADDEGSWDDELHRRAASAGPDSFPLSARIFGTIRGINGKLGFTNPRTGQPEYTMDLEIEDGSLLVPARLGAQFMREFFDVEPREFQALLADPARKLEGVELAKGLQKLLSSYSGLIEVELEAPRQPLVVRNIGQELREDDVAALQRRTAGALPPTMVPRFALALAALCLMAGAASAATVLDCAKLPATFGQDDDIQGNGPWSAVSDATLKAISDNSDKLIAYADADERAALAGWTGGACDKPTLVAAGCEQSAKVGKNYALQVNVTCGDSAVGYVALVTSDGKGYWNVEDSSVDFVQQGGKVTPGLTVTQGADLLEKRSFTCDQLPATWGSVPTSASKMGKWAALSNGTEAALQGQLQGLAKSYTNGRSIPGWTGCSDPKIDIDGCEMSMDKYAAYALQVNATCGTTKIGVVGMVTMSGSNVNVEDADIIFVEEGGKLVKGDFDSDTWYLPSTDIVTGATHNWEGQSKLAGDLASIGALDDADDILDGDGWDNNDKNDKDD
ncbi:recQ-mediated genome instability 1 [Chlorella sorokiniana]|uniref:RecQ-mediated genome instability protein 1 n=1 Tax=Chlorella sorokiniana TaxID=3076 RepID=A0A2P6TY87_CHLSO|nr:recQ-mediated genome instability 1 [Chlorella sorokiniana]|eukprot:PRW59034.1 recQ-mediated genome instability 1 [Chlorella sorokiniana]